MSKTHLIIPDQHAHPDHDNIRAEWLGKLIADVKPDVVVNIGDAADMQSLSSYDKGRAAFHNLTYERDINSHLDFQERLWHQVRKTKKKMPDRFIFEGNHEHRIARALDIQPNLKGWLGLEDLQFEKYYDEVIYYDGDTPGSLIIDGIRYAHYFITGISGRALGGEHPAYTLVTKNLQSSTCGHSHVIDFCMRGSIRKVYGCVVGCYQDYVNDWAGEIGKLWWSGVVIKRNVEDGQYDIEFVSLNKLRKEYG